MNNHNFDTHKFVEDMVEAKMPKAQAEVLASYYARLLNDSITILNDSIATLKDSTTNKDDLNNLEKRFGDKLEQTEKRFGDKLEHSRQLLEEKIEAVRAEIKQTEKRFGDKLEQTELRILNKILVMQIASVGLIIAALGVFFAALQY